MSEKQIKILAVKYLLGEITKEEITNKSNGDNIFKKIEELIKSK